MNPGFLLRCNAVHVTKGNGQVLAHIAAGFDLQVPSLFTFFDGFALERLVGATAVQVVRKRQLNAFVNVAPELSPPIASCRDWYSRKSSLGI